MKEESGRMAEATGLSQAEPASSLVPSGFDPSRAQVSYDALADVLYIGMADQPAISFEAELTVFVRRSEGGCGPVVGVTIVDFLWQAENARRAIATKTQRAETAKQRLRAKPESAGRRHRP